MNADKPHYTDAEKIKRLTAWHEADKKELAAQAAAIAQLATAARPFAHPDLCKRLPNNGTSSDDQAVIFVRNNAVITLADCKKLAAALAALEQETK